MSSVVRAAVRIYKLRVSLQSGLLRLLASQSSSSGWHAVCVDTLDNARHHGVMPSALFSLARLSPRWAVIDAARRRHARRRRRNLVAVAVALTALVAGVVEIPGPA